jgi:hypothetical protein
LAVSHQKFTFAAEIKTESKNNYEAMIKSGNIKKEQVAKLGNNMINFVELPAFFFPNISFATASDLAGLNNDLRNKMFANFNTDNASVLEERPVNYPPPILL